jgi:peptidyl-prolyl cis-trans isomerase B (cyclophilin B)
MIRRLAVFLLLATPLFAEDPPAAESKLPMVSMETTYGTLKIELYIKDAPNTVVSFLQLCDKKFYDGLKFHRIIKKFMAQGGDPSGNGTGGPGYNIPLEISAHKHVKGTLSMARTSEPNSAGSQFFLCFTDTPFLDNQYTVFGQVTEGMDVLTKMEEEAGADRDPQPPLKEVKIISARVLSRPEKLPELISVKPEEVPFFGITPNNKESVDGLMIGRMHPKGGAQLSGLQVGDLIKKVGDVEVKNLPDFAKAVFPSKPGKPVTFTVMRNGQETKIEVTPTKMDR